MKIVLFYFSGTGNTWWTSLLLKTELENLGHTLEMYSLENSTLKEEGFTFHKIWGADHIIIGYPVYGSGLPANMEKFINSLPHVSDNKKFSAFCTQASFSGDGNIFFQKNIEKKGFIFQQSFQINMTTNLNVAMFPFSLSKPAEGVKLEKIKSKASTKIKKMAIKISKNEKHIEGKKFYQVLLGWLQRSLFRRYEKQLPDKFYLTKEKCTKCKLCVEICPTDNLILETEYLDFTRKNKCMLCFRCYNFCPNHAINFGTKVTDSEKYKRYLGPIDKLKIPDIRK